MQHLGLQLLTSLSFRCTQLRSLFLIMSHSSPSPHSSPLKEKHGKQMDATSEEGEQPQPQVELELSPQPQSAAAAAAVARPQPAEPQQQLQQQLAPQLAMIFEKFRAEVTALVQREMAAEQKRIYAEAEAAKEKVQAQPAASSLAVPSSKRIGWMAASDGNGLSSPSAEEAPAAAASASSRVAPLAAQPLAQPVPMSSLKASQIKEMYSSPSKRLAEYNKLVAERKQWSEWARTSPLFVAFKKNELPPEVQAKVAMQFAQIQRRKEKCNILAVLIAEDKAEKAVAEAKEQEHEEQPPPSKRQRSSATAVTADRHGAAAGASAARDAPKLSRTPTSTVVRASFRSSASVIVAPASRSSTSVQRRLPRPPSPPTEEPDPFDFNTHVAEQRKLQRSALVAASDSKKRRRR